MKAWRKMLWPTLAVVWLSGVALGGWWWRLERRAAEQALRRLAQVEMERVQLEAATEGSGAELDALAQAEAELDRTGGGWQFAAAGPTPAHSTDPLDCWLEVSALVEELRDLAVEAGVAIDADESFGFASHRQEAPTRGEVEELRRQLRTARSVLTALLAARPARLLAVQRERADSAADSSEHFALDPRLSLREAGVIGATALLVEFSGGTAALRSFLNRLADSSLPLVVRSVEAGPAVDGGAPAGRLPDELHGPQPVVRPVETRFRVIVEHLWLLPLPAA